MASTTKSLRSGTANKRPTTSIAEGQIALNTNATSPGLYFKDSTGAAIIKIGPVHVGTTAPNVAPAGSSGNSTGEAWLDTSLTPNGWKVWTGAAWVNATPAGSETVQGLLELATNAETQAGSDTARAVTPAGLQSKVSDSTSITSSTTIASSTAVKAAYDLANAALPKAGGTVTGNLEIGTTGSLTFEGATADAFETTLAVVDPTADRTITLPNVTGTVVTTGDTGSVTNAMVNASAGIAGTKISPDFGSQNIATTGIFSHALGTAGSPTITFTGDTNTGIYSPAADTLAFVEGGVEALRIDSSGRLLVGTSTARSNFFNSTNTALVQIEGFPDLALTRTANDQFGSNFIFAKTRSSGNTAVQNNDILGLLSFQGSDGSEFVEGAFIQAQVDGTPGANDMPGRLVFSTTADGASIPSQRIVIRQNGQIEIFNCPNLIPAVDNTSALGASGFRWTAVWAANGTIQTSDARAKVNIADSQLGVSFIKSLRPVSYKWSEGGKRDTGERDENQDYIYESVPGTRTHWGFLAQEVKEAVDAAGVDFGGWVLTDKDDPDSQQALRYDQFIAPLTKALQEAIAKIEILEARLTAAGIE